MLVNRAYYFLKPVLPWRLRLMLRRWRANLRRRTFADVWPIDPRSARIPQGWPGWPGGKQFAVVLTHDVEDCKGLSRVRQLGEIEQKHGFRSCFNFVPEGEYRIPDALRFWLEEADFEVGVHGLEHDGKLYSSKEEFAAKAERINGYLCEWNARGFRSPLMQHRLGWLHALNVDYDTSTFDTDPFEPESDGAGTIFPFWVQGPGSRGYVELPYTLIQDFNLFGVLRERNIDVWKRKTDWVAERGGMLLLNTHPDYMCFGGEPARDEVPVSFYEEFLEYLQEKYAGRYWHALPREVSAYYRQAMPLELRNTRRKICMLGYTPYEGDNRVRRYAETLAQRGDHVDMIGLSREESQPATEEVNGVTVYRVQHREHNERNKWTYAWRLLKFLFASSRKITQLHKLNRYDVVHIHNMPDFLVFAAWYPKLTGAKVILDIHDVVPELFGNKFQANFKSVYVEALKAIEKLSADFADHVIVSNDLWHEKIVARSVAKERSSVFINHVDPKMFARRSKNRTDDRFIILFPGSLQWHQGVDIAIEALARIKPQIPNAEFHIYCGSGVIQGDLQELTQKLGVEDSVKFLKAVPLDQMAQVIADADLGVVPKRADSFGNEAYSTKIMEFMSQGVPVVVSRTKIDSYYFDEGVVHFFKSGDSESMASAILDVYQNRALRESLVRRGYEYVDRYSWDQKKKDYLGLIDSLATEDFSGIQGVATFLEEAPKGPTGHSSGTVARPAGVGRIPLASETARSSVQTEAGAAHLSLEGTESERHEPVRI
jgi:glycosyltransferase involved in cell wall biosynthesis/peptidoglycan/xylan/chitin deacetylase (PgdA/CDA1 family)